ncbi:ABC-type multidrug transport system ATPase subunit [Saccharothrix ecbatanensis]|uniref:ABC-type multidrug transport system ATPase subunit n=1 Tax=Saccharothrix ecbatanensis TaxID=1105145 RepID=A0A7W9HJN8_9PSEU|nr:ABC transporter ATP-binding protein [Saccharothrix ecbatanensis]MBB5803064.1 ABC-type multidrug transport system ATPase subunit [Saccharothrix ecbatanensis]
MSTEDFTLQAVDVHKAFGPRRVLEGVDFALRPGEIMGIIGENGAGKTTLLRILAGELKPDRGSVAHRDRLGYCPQRIVLNDELTVDQHLRYFRSAYHLDSLDRAEELVERLDLAKYRRARAGVLSGGTRQKLNLVLALMHDPGVVLMDEPYQGFDWDNYLTFWSITGELRDRGQSVLVISHIAHDLERFDRMSRLRAGRVVAEQPSVPLPVPRTRKAAAT